jgi:hypothetical protein
MTTPAAAPSQTNTRKSTRSWGARVSTATGVYEPAISTKIMEWSSRCMTGRRPGDHETRW